MQDVDKLRVAYRDLLIRANKKQNLIARGDVQNLFEKLFIESLLPLNWEICKLNSPILDIGSGAGFPGIPLKISLADHCTTLLDSNRRKCLFLRNVIETLGFSDTDVVNRRVEEITVDPIYMGHYNSVVSRATAPLAQLVEWSRELLKPGGELITWKGSSVEDELKEGDFLDFKEPDFQNRENGLVLVRMEKL